LGLKGSNVSVAKMFKIILPQNKLETAKEWQVVGLFIHFCDSNHKVTDIGK